MAGGLGEKVQETLAEGIREGTTGLLDNLQNVLIGAWQDTISAIFEGIAPLLLPVVRSLLRIENLPPDVRQALERIEKGEDPLLIILSIQLYAVMLTNVIAGALRPWGERAYQEASGELETARAEPSLATRLVNTGQWPLQKLIDHLRDQGWSMEDAVNIYFSLANRPTAQDLITARLRGTISHDEYLREMGANGYQPVHAELLLQLAHLIPPPTDLIRMAVREAFNPEVIRKFRYLEDFPAEFAQWAEKLGIDREWAERYWVAHWELPSPTMGFEMFHRTVDDSTDPDADDLTLPSGRKVQNVIGRRTLELLLRTADIAPFWRDKIIAVSYRPLNRVDVRRMFRMGVIDVDEVYRAYLDIGYNPRHAAMLTEWTVKEYGEGSRDLTKADILTAYREKRVTREDAKNMLIDLGYEDWEADVLLGREDYRREREREQLIIRLTRTQYTRGIIDRTQALQQLGELNLPSEQMQLLLETWDAQKQRKTRVPPLRDLVDFFQAGIITEEELREELSNLGFQRKYIDWYIRLMRG